MEHKKECYFRSDARPISDAIDIFISKLKAGEIKADKEFAKLYNQDFREIVFECYFVELETRERTMRCQENYTLMDYVKAHYVDALIDDDYLFFRSKLTVEELERMTKDSFGKSLELVKEESPKERYDSFKNCHLPRKHGFTSLPIPAILVPVNCVFFILGLDLIRLILADVFAVVLAFFIRPILEKCGLKRHPKENTDSDNVICFIFMVMPLLVGFISEPVYQFIFLLLSSVFASFVFLFTTGVKEIFHDTSIFVLAVIRKFISRGTMSYEESMTATVILMLLSELFFVCRKSGTLLPVPFNFSGRYLFVLVGGILFEIAIVFWVRTALKFEELKTIRQVISEIFKK